MRQYFYFGWWLLWYFNFWFLIISFYFFSYFVFYNSLISSLSGWMAYSFYLICCWSSIDLVFWSCKVSSWMFTWFFKECISDFKSFLSFWYCWDWFSLNLDSLCWSKMYYFFLNCNFSFMILIKSFNCVTAYCFYWYCWSSYKFYSMLSKYKLFSSLPIEFYFEF